MIPLACVIFAHRIQDLDLLMLKQFLSVLVVKTHFGRFLALFLAVWSAPAPGGFVSDVRELSVLIFKFNRRDKRI